MKRILKGLAWLVGVTAVVLLGAHLALKVYLNSAGFKAMVAEQVEKSLHRKAELGELSYSLLPPAVVARNVALKEKDGQSNFVAFEEMSLRFDLSKREFSSLLLRKPEVQVVQYAGGAYNFSDLLPVKPQDETSPTVPPKPAEPAEPTEAKPPAKAQAAPRKSALPVNIALVQVEDARFNFTRVEENGTPHPFTLSGLNLDVRNIRLNQPVLFESSVKIGRSSSLDWTLDLGPLGALPPDLANMQMVVWGQLHLQSFEDIGPFLTKEQLESMPVTSLVLDWKGTGTIASGFAFDLQARTPEVGGKNKLYINLDTRVSVTIPEAVVNHLVYRIPLPAEIEPPAPPAEAIPGEPQIAAQPALGLLLKTLRIETTLKTDRLAYEQNAISNVEARLVLKDGQLTIAPLRLELFGGTAAGTATADLLAYPLRYSLENLELKNVQIQPALAAQGGKVSAFASGVSGSLQAAFHLSGQGLSSSILQRALQAKGSFAARDGQRVGTGETFVDRVMLKLDNPLLIRLIPDLAPRIEEARTHASQVTTTRIEQASADFDLAGGVASLRWLQLGTSDYVLNASGQAWPFDDTIKLQAKIRFSPEATTRLTGGRDLSDKLPYENGGLVIPMLIAGSLTNPMPMPDVTEILRILGGAKVKNELGNALESLGGADNPDVQKGIQILDNFLGGIKR